jgi:SsrA-binding protein
MAKDASVKLISDNRKARFNYELMERVEAGIVLTGTEVKSLRAGKLNLGDSYCDIDRNGEMYLVDAHISPYTAGNRFNVDPLRRRKLLLHRKELARMDSKVKEKGLTIVPTRVYFKHGMVKVEVALARGKKLHDKRAAIQARDMARETRRAVN